MTSMAHDHGAATQAEAAPLFNPFDPEFRVDPYSAYRRIRELAPVHQTTFGGWIFSRYADCLAVLDDHRRFSSDSRKSIAYQAFVEQRGGLTPEEEAMQASRPFLFQDPPDHTRLRGLVSKAFTPRVVEALRPRIQQLVDELIDAASGGSMEVIEELAYPLPVTVICEMLGVPLEDQHTFKVWSRELARSLDPDPFLPDDVLERRNQAITASREYFRALIEKRRRDPSDDLISALIAVEEQGDVLSEQELLSTCSLLLVAGHETTVNLIGNGVLALLRHPDQLQMLRADPSLARSAVEEVLRYDPPVQIDGRVALEDVEVGGAPVRKGQDVILLLGSANRDPDQFPDPDRLDITRAENHHIAFGYGIHFCLGAPLARVEGQVALGTLVRRLDGLRLLTDRPAYKENIVLRGLAGLPVGFSSVRP